MAYRTIRQAIVLTGLSLPVWCQPGSARAEDAVDFLLRTGRLPADMIQQHGYSDSTEPIGRFLDFLAAGAVAEARAVQPAACASWLATRHNSPLTGKFGVWHTELDLNTLCEAR